jgi:hypothetical protein
MSVTSAVYNYRYENGRRYHAYADGSELCYIRLHLIHGGGRRLTSCRVSGAE